jgi:hypothetical protein
MHRVRHAGLLFATARAPLGPRSSNLACAPRACAGRADRAAGRRLRSRPLSRQLFSIGERSILCVHAPRAARRSPFWPAACMRCVWPHQHSMLLCAGLSHLPRVALIRRWIRAGSLAAIRSNLLCKAAVAVARCVIKSPIFRSKPRPRTVHCHSPALMHHHSPVMTHDSLFSPLLPRTDRHRSNGCERPAFGAGTRSV